MELVVLGGARVAAFAADGALLSTEADALDLLGATFGQDVDLLLVPVTRFDPAFFDLSTGLAGAFLQKMSNYGARLAIEGDIAIHLARSAALRAFVAESNAAGRVLFVADRTALIAALSARGN
ncbi:MAG: DUF4180 domain-containing protein [Devosia sp.]